MLQMTTSAVKLRITKARFFEDSMTLSFYQGYNLHVMNILVVSQYFYPESFRVNDLVQTLVASGHRVTVLTAQPNYPKGEFFAGYSPFSNWRQKYQGAEVLRVPIFPRGKGRRW